MILTTELNGNKVLRMCTLHPETTEEDIISTINRLCMQVQDIEAAKAALEAAGVVFETEIQLDPDLYENGEKSARFRGPDGEMLQIEQIL